MAHAMGHRLFVVMAIDVLRALACCRARAQLVLALFVSEIHVDLFDSVGEGGQAAKLFG